MRKSDREALVKEWTPNPRQMGAGERKRNEVKVGIDAQRKVNNGMLH